MLNRRSFVLPAHAAQDGPCARNSSRLPSPLLARAGHAQHQAALPVAGVRVEIIPVRLALRRRRRLAL